MDEEEEESRKFAKWSENLSVFELNFLSHDSFSVFFSRKLKSAFYLQKSLRSCVFFFISWVWANISGHNVAFNTDVRGVGCWAGRGGRRRMGREPPSLCSLFIPPPPLEEEKGKSRGSNWFPACHQQLWCGRAPVIGCARRRGKR